MGVLAPTGPKPKLTPAEQYAADDEMVRAYHASRNTPPPEHKAVLGAPVTDQQMADKGYEVQINPAAPAEVPVFPGVAGSDEAGTSSAEGTEAAIDARGMAFPRMSVGMAPRGVVMGPGEDYSTQGGAHGKSDWEDTFVTKPAQIEQAVMEGAEQEGKLGEAKGDYWKRTQKAQEQEFAVLQARRLENQQQIAQQQQEIQKATERYSNDLADRGQFWKNPAHILGAISASLMALGSGGPAIGQKLINDAVNADFQQRKDLANMHLGELRSNLHSYRQIAGDREMGDKMALAESYRVAAMELERISAQFQGPIAKARAQAGIKDLLMQKQVLMMNMFNHGIFQKAEVVDPRIAAAKMAGAKGLPEGVGYTPFAVAGKPDAATSAGVGPYSQPGQSMSGQPTNPPMDHVIRSLIPPIPEDMKARWEARAPGSSRQVDKERMDVARRIWSVSGGNPATFNTKMEAFEAKQEDDIKGIAVAAQPLVARIDGYRRLGTDLKLIKVMADRLHTDPDTLLGNGASAILGKEFMAKYKDTIHLLGNTDPDNANKYARELQETEAAVERFKQVLAGAQNTYIHDKSGGNVSANENLRMKEYLRQGYRGILAFQDNESKLAQTEFNNATNSAAHPVSGTMYRIQMGIGSSPLDRQGIAGPDKSEVGSGKGATEAIERKANVQRAIKTVKGR